MSFPKPCDPPARPYRWAPLLVVVTSLGMWAVTIWAVYRFFLFMERLAS